MDIKPLKVWPTELAQRLLGLPDLPLELDPTSIPPKLYLFKEPSGIIRSGVTVEFYNSYKVLFKTCVEELNQ